jgi:hypothetical protein
MVLLLPNALWHKRMLKHVKSCKQEKYYEYNAELLCEEANALFTVGIKSRV